MKAIKFEKIKKQYEGWLDANLDNKMRAEKHIDFVIANNQWEGDVVAKRQEKSQESLTFNHTIKHLRRAYSQASSIEFSLNLIAVNSMFSDNINEQNALRGVLNTALLNDDALNKFDEALKKTLAYSYAVAVCGYGYEDSTSLNLVPRLHVPKDPSIAFFDKNAPDPCKIKGRFSGLCRSYTDKELIDKYPSLKRAGWIKKNDNQVFDYWFRDSMDAVFVTLKSGVQKREDLLTPKDKENWLRGSKDEVRKIDCIYFERICEGKVLEDVRKWPTDDLLPIVYHPALTEWHPRHGDITIPYCEYMKGSQVLLNFVLSQAATQAKNSTGDKWFFNKSHVATESQRVSAKEINKRDGGFVFGDDVQTIRREQPAQIAQSLLETAQLSKNEIDEINGAMLNTQDAQRTVISGKALREETENNEVLNAWIEAGHILFVKAVGDIYRQMIPKLYTQERVVLVKNKDGSGKSLVINQDAGTGTLINNIRDINNNFYYEITAGPSSKMQKENTRNALIQVYQIDPAMFRPTAHIFFDSLDTKDSAELMRIAKALGDFNLIRYSQGEISWEEYQQAKDQQMQQQMQMQMQMAQMNPQVQSAKAIAEAEHRKAGADEMNAQTKREEMINKAQTEQMKIKAQLIQAIMNNGVDVRQQDIDQFRAQLEEQQQIIDAMRMQEQAYANTESTASDL